MGIKLLYGEETYLLETKLKKIKKEFGELIQGINFIQIDASNVQELIADIETPAFGYEKKLILARNFFWVMYVTTKLERIFYDIFRRPY